MAAKTRQYAVTIYNTLGHYIRLDCIEASSSKAAATKALYEACLLDPHDFSLKKPPNDGIFKIGIIRSNQLWIELIDKSLGACSSYLVAVSINGHHDYRATFPQRDPYLWRYCEPQ